MTTPATLSIAYSPCPNDTFVFHALAHGLIPGAPALDVTYADIDITNKLAATSSELDVLKISYAALPYVLPDYALLPCGGALGRGCGPLVLTREPAEAASLAGKRVAVPSDRSTAYLLFRLGATPVQGTFGAIGYTVATTETYKTFFFPSKPRGKFAGKPVRFPDWLEKRKRFVPLYVLIWLLVIAGFVAALTA